MRRLAARLVLSLALAVAGCGGLAGGAGETATVTPVRVPDDPATGSASAAPGMTNERLVDPSVLVRSHAERLETTPHTFRERVTRRYPNGTVQSRYTTVVQRNGTAVRYRYDWTSAGSDTERHVDRFAADGRIYIARTEGNETTYEVRTVRNGTTSPVRTVDYADSLTRVFGLLSISVDGTERRNGSTAYRLDSGQPRDVPPLRNATFVGTVTPDGLVTDYRVRYTVQRADVPVEVTVAVSIEDVGTTTIDRPAWYDRAVAEGG